MNYRHYIISTIILWSASASSFAKLNDWQKSDGPYGAIRSGIGAITIDSSGGIYVGALGIFYATPGMDQPSWENRTGRYTGWVGNSPVQLMVAPKNTSLGIYAASAHRVFQLSPGATTWKNLSTGLGQGRIEALAVNSRGDIFCASYGDMLKRDRDDDYWLELQIPGDGPIQCAIGRDDALFVARSDGSLSRSTDAGNNWKTIIPPIDDHYRLLGKLLTISPKGDIYYFRQTLFRSTDNGESWTEIPGSSFREITAIAVGSNDEIYIAANDWDTIKQGFYVSRDQGKNWSEPMPGVRGKSITAITAGDHCYLSYGSRVARSTDRGGTWSIISDNLVYNSVQLVDINAAGFMAINHGSLISVSPDRGTTLTEKTYTNPTALCVDDRGNLLFGIGNEFWRSKDTGTTWTKDIIFSTHMVIDDIEVDHHGTTFILTRIIKSSGIAATITRCLADGTTWIEGTVNLPEMNGIADLEVDTDGNIYAAVHGLGIYRSVDGGDKWDRLYTVPSGNSFRKISIHPSGDIIAIDAKSITRYSTDSARRYTRSYDKMTLNDIAISRNGYCMVATSEGMLISPDGSDQFYSDPEAPLTFTLCVEVDEQGTFYAGVEENGLWYTKPETGASVQSSISPAALSLALSPNPTADRLAVRYVLPDAQPVAIELHDLFGRSVLHLDAGYQTAGNHQTDLDLHDVPNGTYFLSLKLRDGISTVRLCVADRQ